MDYQTIIDKYYPAGTTCRGIFVHHSQQVANKALEIIAHCRLDLNPKEVETAAMLHDIGIFMTDAPDIDCHGSEPYICHGIIGADLLRKEGYDEKFARVAERHTGAGLTIDDIVNQNLPLPVKEYCPETLLEKLICYADKFFSKSGAMREKPIEEVISSMSRFSNDTLSRFYALHTVFTCNKDNKL